MIRLILILLFLAPFASLSNTWTKADGPYSYNSASSIFSFNNDLHFYSSIDSFVHKNNSEKEEWLKLDTGFFADKGIIYYFDQKDNIIITTTQKGVFISYDYGDTWKFSDFKWYGNTFALPYIEIVDQTIFLQSSNTSLYKFELGSDSYEKIYTDDSKVDSIFGHILISNGSYMFAASPKETFSDLPEFGTLYISKDKGKTWKLTESMKERLVNLLYHNNILFAFTKEDKLYKSTDNGETWTTDTNVKIRGTNVISYKDLMFACSNQVMVSSDSGTSWNALNDGLDWYSCKNIIKNDDKLYYQTGRNLIYSFDYDQKYWDRISPKTDDIYQGFITEERDTLFSTGEFTINYSIDKGETWELYSDSLYNKYSGLGHLEIRDNIFIGISQTRKYFYISTNNGKSWRYESLGISNQDGWIDNILIMGDRILVTSSKEGNHISYDAGTTWTEFENDVISNEVVILNFNRLSDTDIILYSKDGLFKTYDNGLTWEFEKTDEEVIVGYFTYMNGNHIYSFYINNSFLKSTDLGRSWIKLELSLAPELIWTHLVLYNDYLILLTTTDVFVSNNDGKDWLKYDVNILTPEGKELYFNNGVVSGEYLVLTSNFGNWRAKLTDLGIEVKSSVESEIERNYLYTYPPYPNPAKSDVKVLFYWDINLPMTKDDISIYDITGKKIDAVGKINLVKQESHYGNLIWDCSSAQPGIYLINIKHGTEEKAVKVVVE